MDKLFLSVLNMSLTGAFVITAICLARLLLKKAPKIISYALWAVAGFRLVFPFSIESVFSLLPFKAQLIPPDIAMQPIPRIDSGIPFVNNAVSSVLPAAAHIDSVNPLQVWTFIGSWIWIIVVAVMLVYGVVSFVILKRKMQSTAHVEANIYEADCIQSPFVLGVFAPKIYLPAGLSEHERVYILLHEQMHIRCCDHIVKFAAYFVLCLHWFNPLAWVAFLLMGADMEMSCDERVLKEMGSNTKKDYSLSLLSLSTERRIIGGSPLAFGEGGVKERVKRVLNFKKPSRVVVVAAIALVAVLSAGFAVNRANDNSFVDMELIEQGSSILVKIDGRIYDSTNELGADGIAADSLRGKQIGYARLDGQNYRWRIFECNGYSLDEFIIVRPDEMMSNFMVYKAGRKFNKVALGTYYADDGITQIILLDNHDFYIVRDTMSFTLQGTWVYETAPNDNMLLFMAPVDERCVFSYTNNSLTFEGSLMLENWLGIEPGTVFALSELVRPLPEAQEPTPDPYLPQVMHDRWQRDITPTPANWTRNQPLGVDNPILDYAGQTVDADGIIRTRVIFHGYFGLFVYDTREQEIIFSLDLKAIGCDSTQGDTFCEVAVNTMGDVVTLHPMNSDTMYVLTLWDSNPRLFETPFDNNYMTKFRTVVIGHAFPGDGFNDSMLGKYSDTAVAFSAAAPTRYSLSEEYIYYGFLYFEDGTLGGIFYQEDDMGFRIFK